jgi:hypothetical protein
MSAVETRVVPGAIALETGEKEIQRSAVINPYALAELVAGRRILWKQVDDVPRLLEEILQAPYEELFDPRYDSPLYLGFRLNAEMQLERTVPQLPELRSEAGNDLDHYPDGVDIRRLADLGPLLKTDDIGAIGVERATVHASGIDLRVRLTETIRLERIARAFRPELIDIVVFLPDRKPDGFNPPNTTWTDSGSFFKEAAEFFDPIQGAVANCYLIAAMASVAWARPYMISHLTRATGLGQEQFTDRITFYDIDHGNAKRDIEVTEATIVSSGGFPVYCRSSEEGEIWPAVYEKAFAKWKTAIAGDHPDITATAWGDCVRASAELTGLTRHYYETSSLTADQLWNIVRANSLSYRTFNPMVAATYGSGESSPDKVVYADANIAAAHCYSVLGWAYENRQKYIVLRNPWGHTEATVNPLGGTAWFYDVSWWRPIALANPDGVFAIRADTFKQYFGWLGSVS